MARPFPGTQPIISRHIRLRFFAQRKARGRPHIWLIRRFAIQQPVQQVQNMCFGRDTSLKRQFHGA